MNVDPAKAAAIAYKLWLFDLLDDVDLRKILERLGYLK